MCRPVAPGSTTTAFVVEASSGWSSSGLSLRQIGIEIAPVGFRNFEPWELLSAAGRRTSRHAFAAVDSCGDQFLSRTFPDPQLQDPYEFINPFFDGRTIEDEYNTNVSYFDDPAYNRRIERAAALTGTARLNAYTAIEHDLVTKAAPWAAWGQSATQFLLQRQRRHAEFRLPADLRSAALQPAGAQMRGMWFRSR